MADTYFARETKLSDIDPDPNCPEVVRMIVESGKNSTNKYEFDIELGVFRLDRSLYSPIHYPGDYGFVPGTIAEDGDPIHILAIGEQPSFPGCMIEVRPVGILDMAEDSEVDHEILAIPARNPRYDQIGNIQDVPAHILKEIEHFFEIYRELEGKKTQMEGWRGTEAVREAIGISRQRYLSARRPSISD